MVVPLGPAETVQRQAAPGVKRFHVGRAAGGLAAGATEASVRAFGPVAGRVKPASLPR
jgi:hypothetical protein